MDYKNIVIAFSGGLDTSYLVAWFKETTNARITTVTVNTGGFSEEEIKNINARAAELGADDHRMVDGRQETFDRVIRMLIQGNVLRGSVYPLSVSAERITQAEILVRTAAEVGADAVVHGSTGAGNDQIRFDVAVRTMAPGLKILAPVREHALTRDQETTWLRTRNISVKDKTSVYSVNAGMWGTTIGGGTIHDSWQSIPDDAYPTVVAPNAAPDAGATVTIKFEKGVPVSLNGETLLGPILVEKLNALGAANGVGRGVHLGDTIMGIKGRIAFEAPAAMILITAHRELEKLVLSRKQQFWKDKLGDFYGALLHEAEFYDPVARDIEAMIQSSQRAVTGEVRVSLKKGILTVEGIRSAYSLMAAAKATYGETQSLWDGRDAEGFTKIYGLQGRLAKNALKNAGEE
jgi:argininosuccinate synthase